MFEQDKNGGDESHAQRVRVLEEAIQEAIFKLEQTKKSFKSRQIKEVRERLTSVIVNHE